jgi:hypothetical protein
MFLSYPTLCQFKVLLHYCVVVHLHVFGLCLASIVKALKYTEIVYMYGTNITNFVFLNILLLITHSPSLFILYFCSSNSPVLIPIPEHYQQGQIL